MKLGKALALSLIGVFATAGAVLFASNGTGFAVLSDSNSQGAQDSGSAEFSASLSMQTLGNAELSAKSIKQNAMQCPQFLNLEFELENKGDSTAERIAASFSGNLKVQDCINCSIARLAPSEKATVKARACRLDSESAFVEFKAVNSGAERVLAK